MTSSIRFPALVAALAVLLGACDSPTANPTVASASGEYQASTLSFTQGGQTYDFLAAGAKLTMSLKQDGTTTGELFLPGVDEDGGDVREDLAGQWTLRADTVRFSQSADTFLRDVPFVVRRGRLTAEYGSDGARIEVVLRK
jgi:hypothetical protein